DSPRATPFDRLEMLRAATANDPRFETLDWEIHRGEISYTIDTVRQARKTFPSAQLIWIVGEDQLAKLPRWHEIDELCRLADFACLQRPGHTVSAPPEIPNLRLHPLVSHRIELSSTEIRQRVRENRALRFLLPDTVIDYIERSHLYTACKNRTQCLPTQTCDSSKSAARRSMTKKPRTSASSTSAKSPPPPIT